MLLSVFGGSLYLFWGLVFVLEYLCSGVTNCDDTVYTYQTRYFFLSCMGERLERGDWGKYHVALRLPSRTMI